MVCVCVCVSLLQSHAKPSRPQTPLSELCDLQTPTTSGAGLQTHQTQGKADRQTDRQTDRQFAYCHVAEGKHVIKEPIG